MAVSPQRPTGQSNSRETWALVLLTIGLVTGPIGLIVGWVLVAGSTRWTSGEKLAVAALPIPIFVLALPIVGGFGGYQCSGSSGGPEVCQSTGSASVGWILVVAMAVVVVAAVTCLGRAARPRIGRP
jgi:H+/Cl- antiporter ClcA